MNRQMTKQKPRKAEIQTYRISFGGDDSLYSVSFKAALSQPEVNRLLASARSILYENLPKTILDCLNSSRLEYSDFVSDTARLEHETVMAIADSLLHDSSGACLDRLAGSADSYYGIMDYQRQTGRSCYEGCCYAVSRTVSMQNQKAECYVIGQTIRYDISSGRENSFFAIRRKENGHPMYTLEELSGCPVLSPFGCVDVAGLLLNIYSVTAKEHAARIANR